MPQNCILNVADLLQKEIGTQKTYQVSLSRLDIDQEVLLKTPAEGTVTVVKVEEGGLLVSFHLNLVVEVECARCLKRFNLPVRLNYTDEFSIQNPESTNQITPQNTIDLLPSIIQEIILALPLKPICQMTCQGIKIGAKNVYPKTKKISCPPRHAKGSPGT